MGLWRTMALASIGAAALALAGCTNDADNAQTQTPTFAAPDQVCPAQLPLPPGGSEESWDLAAESPELPAPDAAWLCEYTVNDFAADGEGPPDWVWSREGEPRELADAGLDVAGDLLSDLSVFPDEIACTADLGPRWLVAFQVRDELWGVTINEYGCREARLTEDPFAVAAGHSQDPRLVQGSLQPPTGILDDLKAAAGSA